MKTKALISFAVTAKLICVFVFAYAKRWFSHNAAHIIILRCLFFLLFQLSDHLSQSSYSGENLLFAYAKTKTQKRLCFRYIDVVQPLFFLNMKFQAHSYLLWLHSTVCVGPGQKSRRPVFSRCGSFTAGLPRSGKKVWKMKFFSRSGNFNFSPGNLEKNDKSQGKVREFEKFPKKSIGKKGLKIIISINCKKLMIRNTT